MTKQEILALIDAKVAGQGNQLDLGGGVVEALKEIVNAIPEGGLSPVLPEPTVRISNLTDFSGQTEDFVTVQLSTTVEKLRNIYKQLVVGVGNYETYVCVGSRYVEYPESWSCEFVGLNNGRFSLSFIDDDGVYRYSMTTSI